MKFVALFALFCLAGVAVARQDVPRNEVVNGARGRLSHLDLDLAEDHKPVVHTRAPLEGLNVDATSAPVTPKAAESETEAESHNGHVAGERGTEDHSESASASTGFPVVTDAASTAAPAESTDATSVPVTGDTNSDADDTTGTNTDATNVPVSDDTNSDADNTTDASTSEKSTSDATTDKVTDSSNTDKSVTDSDSTDSTGTESTNTEPTKDGENQKKPAGLSTASISAIVIGGILLLAVIVAVAMALVRRRRTAPERRGILDA